MGRCAPNALAALALLALACSEPRPVHPPPPPSAERSAPAVTAGPDGEMIPGLALPLPDDEAAQAPADASRESLIEQLATALDEGRTGDAAAIADVLIVLDPDDAEALEHRARALELQGDAAGAAADRKRCCGLGRASCCR